MVACWVLLYGAQSAWPEQVMKRRRLGKKTHAGERLSVCQRVADDVTKATLSDHIASASQLRHATFLVW